VSGAGAPDLPRFIKVMNCSSTLAGEGVELAVATGVGAAGVGAAGVADAPSVPRFIMLMNCASTRTGAAELAGASEVTVTAGLAWIDHESTSMWPSPVPRPATSSVGTSIL
jgi:hypothetical protein